MSYKAIAPGQPFMKKPTCPEKIFPKKNLKSILNFLHDNFRRSFKIGCIFFKFLKNPGMFYQIL